MGKVLMDDILTIRDKKKMEALASARAALVAKELQIKFNSFARHHAARDEDSSELSLADCAEIFTKLNVIASRKGLL